MSVPELPAPKPFHDQGEWRRLCVGTHKWAPAGSVELPAAARFPGHPTHVVVVAAPLRDDVPTVIRGGQLVLTPVYRSAPQPVTAVLSKGDAAELGVGIGDWVLVRAARPAEQLRDPGRRRTDVLIKLTAAGVLAGTGLSLAQFLPEDNGWRTLLAVVLGVAAVLVVVWTLVVQRRAAP